MKDILEMIYPEAINYYIENNLDDFYNKSSEHPNFSSSGNEKISWILARNADWPDCIFKANFDIYNTKSEIENIKNLVRRHIAPKGWTVGPLTKPQNLGSQLEKHGFSNVYQQAGMALELNELKKMEIDETSFKIQKIEEEQSLIQWSEIVSVVFNLKVDIEHLKFMYLQKEAHFYLGIFKEKPISTLLLYLSSGVAGLHAVSTLPEYRNHGFGLTISRSALIDALNMGYYIAVLQASSLGEKVYRKLGFQKYCDIVSYEILCD